MNCARSSLALRIQQPLGSVSFLAGRELGALVGAGQARKMSGGQVQPLYPTEPSAAEKQYHDSLQYHFFFDGIFVAGRVFHTTTLQQHSAWMYDVASGQVTELFEPCYETMARGKGDSLDLESSQMQITDGPSGGSFVAKAKSLRIEFKQDHVFTWAPAGQTNVDGVIHRPDLRCKLIFNGKTLEGTGYSKRYYGLYPRFWGYRFITGVTNEEAQPDFFWSADAAFGDNKYNYYKVLKSSGELISSETADTWQQDTSAYAIIGDVRHEMKITPLCTWETVIGGPGKNMESKMQNRYCTVELIAGGKVTRGVAYNERCYGTLG